MLSITTVLPLKARKEKVPTCPVPGVMAETGLEHVAARVPRAPLLFGKALPATSLGTLLSSPVRWLRELW